MNYQVGDLLMTTGKRKFLCIITEILDNGVCCVMSLKTYSTFRYNKELLDNNRIFQKVA